LLYDFFKFYDDCLYRETLETVSKAGFSVPALSAYHYRIRKISISVL